MGSEWSKFLLWDSVKWLLGIVGFLFLALASFWAGVIKKITKRQDEHEERTEGRMHEHSGEFEVIQNTFRLQLDGLRNEFRKDMDIAFTRLYDKQDADHHARESLIREMTGQISSLVTAVSDIKDRLNHNGS